MIKNTYIYPLLIIVLFALSANCLFAQNKKKKTERIEIASIVQDNEGNPIQNAIVSSEEGKYTTLTNENGEFSILATPKSTILVEAPGYESLFITASKTSAEKIILERALLYASSNDKVQLPLNTETKQRYIVGAISSLDGDRLVKSPELVFSNSLHGGASGLTVIQNSNGLANNSASLFIRGHKATNGNGIVTIVDGIQRPIDDLIPEEIASIEVLKDATAKIMYGSRAANGVILVNTKRGVPYKKIIKFSFEGGIGQPERMPVYLDAYNSAILYNKALVNDGLLPVYTQSDLDGYKNSSGENDLRYPDIDFHDYFLKSNIIQRKITSEFSGGNANAKYSVVGGFQDSKGLEDIGRRPYYSRFNVRGNLDIKINTVIDAFMDIAARLESREMSSLNHGEIFDKLSTHKPHGYPLIINHETLPADSATGVPPLGASLTRKYNLYERLIYGGYRDEKYTSGQSNFGLNFDFNHLVKGLGAKVYVTFDNYFWSKSGKNEAAAIYAQQWTKNALGEDTVIFTKLNKAKVEESQSKLGDQNFRNTGSVFNVSYDRNVDGHGIDLDLFFYHNKIENRGLTQDEENTNLVLRGNYVYKNKYIAELNLAYMGSNVFAKGNRYKLFPATGIAWIISEESFLKNISLIDFMKVKASFGILGYDANIPFYRFEERWIRDGTQNFGKTNGTSMQAIKTSHLKVPDLDWEKSREINVGIEGLIMNQSMSFEMNYFNNYRYDIVIFPNSLHSALYGDLIPNQNFEEAKSYGFEGDLRWHPKINGDFKYSLAANLLWTKSEAIKINEVEYPDEETRKEGKPLDGIWGYIDEGLITSTEQLNSHPVQLIGQYGLGDAAYSDLNNDGIVDPRDKKMIGNSFPRTTLGLNINLYYKGFGAYILTSSQLGHDKLLNNRYYHVDGNDKYSEIVNEYYHAVDNPGGKYPRLTTRNGGHNFANSTLWLEDASFFRIKNVELSYTFSNKSNNPIPKKVKVYARGSNVFLLSKIKELDPEALNGGIENYPILTTITAGLAVTF